MCFMTVRNCCVWAASPGGDGCRRIMLEKRLLSNSCYSTPMVGAVSCPVAPITLVYPPLSKIVNVTLSSFLTNWPPNTAFTPSRRDQIYRVRSLPKPTDVINLVPTEDYY